MNNKDIAAQFLCKDCENYNLCEYYHRRRKDSYICKYFHLSVTPQEPQTFKWCTDCKEYDQEKHSCHRWSKVIRDTVEEMKQEQEPFINKPCVSEKACEHDKNVVLDKIRAEIERGKIGLDIEFNGGIDYALRIIDKYKAESEAEHDE